jgi:hypothetical protein
MLSLLYTQKTLSVITPIEYANILDALHPAIGDQLFQKYQQIKRNPVKRAEMMGNKSGILSGEPLS